MEKTYVISCPICGASLTYLKDELSTICESCKNTVYREKRPQDLNLNLKYAIISDGSAFTTTAEVKTDLSEYESKDDFTSIEPNKLDAIEVSKIDGLVYELTVNYSGDIEIDKHDKERRSQIVEEILRIDPNNIYGRFLRDIIIVDKPDLIKFQEIFIRKDALQIQSYIISFFPLDIGQEIDAIVMIEPVINYIMHTDLSAEDKYYHIIRSFKKYYPFVSIKPSLIENQEPERIIKIVEGYRSLLSALIHLNVSRKMTLDTMKILIEHFRGINNLEIIKLYINYIIQSNIEGEDKLNCIQSFISDGLSPLNSFNECYAYLGFINSLGYDRYTSSKLTQLSIKHCLPKSITFDGYAILNRFIKDSRIRFQETYNLYLRFSDTLFFKQMLVQVLYSQKILDKDDMLLFIDCVTAFAKISLTSEKKLNSMHLNREILVKLGLTQYSDTVKKYHWSKIRTLKKWVTLDKNELLLQILIEKKTLFGEQHKETPKERDMGDKMALEKMAKMTSLRKNVKGFQAVFTGLLSIIIFAAFYSDILSKMTIVFVVAVGAIFYLLLARNKKRRDGAEVSAALILGIIVISIFTGFANPAGRSAGFSIILFILLQLPLYYLAGITVFDPLYNMIITKDKIMLEVLLSDERKERLKSMTN